MHMCSLRPTKNGGMSTVCAYYSGDEICVTLTARGTPRTQKSKVYFRLFKHANNALQLVNFNK